MRPKPFAKSPSPVEPLSGSQLHSFSLLHRAQSYGEGSCTHLQIDIWRFIFAPWESFSDLLKAHRQRIPLLHLETIALFSRANCQEKKLNWSQLQNYLERLS